MDYCCGCVAIYYGFVGVFTFERYGFIYHYSFVVNSLFDENGVAIGGVLDGLGYGGEIIGDCEHVVLGCCWLKNRKCCGYCEGDYD